MSNVKEQLQNLTQKFSSLYEDLRNVDKQIMNAALDEFNALNLRNFVVTDCNVILTLLKTLCAVIPTSESLLVSKSCKLLCRLLKNQQLPPMRCEATCRYLMRALLESSPSVWEDILTTLYVIFKTNGAYVTGLYEDLLGEYGMLFNFLHSDENDISKINVENPYYIELGALKCIQALTLYCDPPPSTSGKHLTVDHLNKCSKVALLYLYKKKQKNQDEINFCEVLICAFNILMQIYSSSNKIEKCLGESIGACRCWMMYALEGCQSITVAPQKVLPSQQSITEVPQSQTNKGGKRMKLRKHRQTKPINNWRDDSVPENTPMENVPETDIQFGDYKAANTEVTQLDVATFPQLTIVSESDVSDWESNRQKKLTNGQVNTRLAALNLLTILIRTSEKHTIFGYWWCFLPGEDTSVICSLPTFLKLETNTGARTAALTVLLNLLTVCRPYLAMAEVSKRSVTSFTPLCVSLGHTLLELHGLLSHIVSTDRRVPSLVAALKCMVACIQATPYHKIGGPILVPMVISARKLLSGDWTVQVAGLIVMGCVISLEPPVADILDVFFKNSQQTPCKSDKGSNLERNKDMDDYSDDDYDEFVEDVFEEEVENPDILVNNVISQEAEVLEVSQETLDKMSWLVEICLRNLGWTFKNGVMEQSRLALVTVRQESLQVLSAIALKYFNGLLATHFKIISRLFCGVLRDPLPDMLVHATKCLNSIGEALQKLDDTSVLNLEECAAFWTLMLRGPLTELLQSDQVAPARAQACDCISSIGERIYCKLPENLKILCATLLLGCSCDESDLVRAAAVRALSVCIMYKEWREDPCLVNDCSESILRVIDVALPTVKIKGTWALANLTDALLLNKDDPNCEQLDNHLLIRLLQQSILSSTSNDKIKMNCMRSIGNILFLVNEGNLNNSELQQLVIKGIDRLVLCASNGNNMKTRWNACHALGKMMKNHLLFSHFKNWQVPVFSCLCKLMENCRNLKVRAHAAMALRSPSLRQLYDDNFSAIWKAVLMSMENATHTEDFTEYKHKDHLVEQLCVTLSHLACLLTPEDLLDIMDATSFLWESASRLLRQVAQRTEPEGETCSKLLEAAKYVTTQLSFHTEGQRECLNIIQNLFIWEG